MLHLLQKPPHLRLLEAHVHLASETSSRQQAIDLFNRRLDLRNSLVARRDTPVKQLAAKNVVLTILLELPKGHRHGLQIEAKLPHSLGRIATRVVEAFELLRALQQLHRERNEASAAGDGTEDFCHGGWICM